MSSTRHEYKRRMKAHGITSKPTCASCGTVSWRMNAIHGGEAYCDTWCRDRVLTACSGEVCYRKSAFAQAIATEAQSPEGHAEAARDAIAGAMRWQGINEAHRHLVPRRQLHNSATCRECKAVAEVASRYNMPRQLVAITWIACKGRCDACGDAITIGGEARATSRLDHNHMIELFTSSLAADLHKSGLAYRGWICNACNATASSGATPIGMQDGPVKEYMLRRGWYDTSRRAIGIGSQKRHLWMHLLPDLPWSEAGDVVEIVLNDGWQDEVGNGGQVYMLLRSWGHA